MIRQPNCLNTVRLMAALLILLGHGIQHLGIVAPQWLIWLISYFRGVPVFFVLSGFLIWESLGRNDGKQYARKRFFRIYPELWGAVTLGLIVMLILYRQTISLPQLGTFTLTQSTFLQFWTPDCLRGYGCGTPNGALWTICVQVQFYIVIWIAYKLLKKRKIGTWLVVMSTCAVVSALLPLLKSGLPEIGYKLLQQTLLPYFWLFMLGCLLAKYSEEILPWLRRLWPVLLILAAVVKWLGFDIEAGYDLLHSSFMTAGLIGFAYCLPKLNIRIDISYGVYIYHMIVINAMIALGFRGSWGDLAITILITCLLALVSTLTLGRLGDRKNKKAGELL